MYERIKYLRKKVLSLTQDDFSKKINMSRSNFASIEINKVNLTERVINDICDKFGISKHWLRTGEGDMYMQTDDSIVEKLAIEYNLSEKQKKIIATFAAMDEKKREVLAEAFFEFVDALTSSPESSATIAVRPAVADNKVSREQAHAILDAQFDDVEKGTTSSAFIAGNGSKMA